MHGRVLLAGVRLTRERGKRGHRCMEKRQERRGEERIEREHARKGGGVAAGSWR